MQKPTSQNFYKKLSCKSNLLQAISWICMKSKMRQYKLQYIAALKWRNENGEGLVTAGDEQQISGKYK